MKILRTNTSDENLHEIFKHAYKVNGNLKILRFAAPNGLREQIINLIHPIDIDSLKIDFIKIIRSPKIKKIELLLINPFSNSFLKKLDAENRSSYDIIRIRNQVIEFVKGFFSLTKQNLFIGLHSNYCIWNLGIVESDNKLTINVKSYGYFGQNIGHDNEIDEFVLESGESTQLAESFLNYFNSLRNDKNTFWILNSDELNKFASKVTFPSLFKGNVVLISKSTDVNLDSFSKMCLNPKSNDAEFQYYKLDKSYRKPLHYFNLPNISRKPHVEREWIGKLNNIEYIPSLRIFDVTSLIHQNFHDATEDLKTKAKELIFFFLDHSLNALHEFRSISSNKAINIKSNKYPYDIQLINALNEIGFLLNQYSNSELLKVKSEFKSLGRYLKQHANCKFRDAQFKNRLLKTQRNEDELQKAIIDEEVDVLKRTFKDKIFDIDFETTIYNVTEWDDICHIFLFENTGILKVDLNINSEEIEKQGDVFIINISQLCNVKINESQKILLWKTVLARSIREYFRRLWYANIMPWNYNNRYAKEGRDYYLELALFALIQTKSYPEIQKLLNYFQSLNNSIWNNINRRYTEKIYFKQEDILNFYTKSNVRIKTSKPNDNIASLLIEIQRELFVLRKEITSKQSFINKANKIIELKPNFFGVGIDLNALIECIFDSK